jgi:hypothetical protein
LRKRQHFIFWGELVHCKFVVVIPDLI